MNWYEVKNIDEIDSPVLLVYPDRIAHNIDCMLANVGNDPQRLSPHVKTHKMTEVVKMQLKKGITRFKCATIAELEMTLAAGASTVVIAYQLTGPKIARFAQLSQKYPHATLASLVDNLKSAQQLANAFKAIGGVAHTYLDLNNGMNRTGHTINENTAVLYQSIAAIENLRLHGLHIYDGHIRNKGFEARKVHSDKDFYSIPLLQKQIKHLGLPSPEIIMGGSPTFKPTSLRDNVICSPGTTLLWDWGYASFIPEIDFQWAALVVTRVISKPKEGIITLDLGHKSVGSENPLDKRVKFLNLSNYKFLGQSEEHLVLEVKNWEQVEVGDVFYGVPFHVCPTVALYNHAHVVIKEEVSDQWKIARGRDFQLDKI